MQATDLLREDHRRVHELFARLETSAGDERSTLLDEIADELEVHAQLEEEIFYPALEAVSGRVQDARAGHEHVRTLVADVQGRDPGSAQFVLGTRVLKGAVLAHVAEEEGAMFIEAGRLGAGELERLGRQIEDRKETLKKALRKAA